MSFLVGFFFNISPIFTFFAYSFPMMGMPFMGLFMGMMVLTLFLTFFLFYHWALIFGLLTLKWSGESGENRTALIIFGVVAIVMSSLFFPLGGNPIYYVGNILGIVAGILTIIAGAISSSYSA